MPLSSFCTSTVRKAALGRHLRRGPSISCEARRIRFFSNSSNTGPSSNSSSSTWKWAAAGTAGVLVISGLDFVAPTVYPGADVSIPNQERTYWKDHNDNNLKKQQKSQTKDRSPLVKDTNNNNPPYYKVVIVGGGMAGLHTALALSERISGKTKDKEILILEAHEIGQSASGKSKGLVVPGIQVPQEKLARFCGDKVAQQIYDLTYQAAKRLKEDIVQRYQIECEWINAGMVEASLHEDEEEEEEEDDDDCCALTATQVQKVLGQPSSTTSLYKCGEYDPTCCGVNPLALTRGLANVLENKFKGVRICEQTKVTTIDKMPTTIQSDGSNKKAKKDAPKYIVTTETGVQIQCQHVVLCTGPELVSKELSQRLANAVIPIYTWMASTVPLGDQCPLQDGVVQDQKIAVASSKEYFFHRHKQKQPAPLCGDDFVSLNYWRRTPDGRILFGSLADAYPIPQWLAEYRLRKSLQQVYPQLADVPFDHVWSGRLALAVNAVPLIGRDEGYDDEKDNNKPSDGGVWYATGFGGHGIVPTVMAGSVLADAMLGLDDDTWRIFQKEFPPKYSFWPFSRLGAQAILITYNVFDWLYVKGVPVPRLPKPW